MEGLVQRIRSRAQRIRSSISAQSAGLYANMADGAAQWWRHPYVKAAAAAVSGFILCTFFVVVPLSVAVCKTGPTPAGPTSEPNPEIPCGTRVPVGPRVINGDEAFPHAFPWMSFFVSYGHEILQGQYFMGNGVLIHKYFVLTNGHVSLGDVVVLGAHNRSDTSEVTQKFVIEAVFGHPNSSANWPDTGMRLAKLYRPANFNMYINRVCPPKRHFSPAAGSCKIVGWGRTNYTGHDLHNDLLHEGSARIISNDQCKRDMPSYLQKYITNATFCTAVDETHATWTDLGSPLLCEQEKGVFGVYGVLFMAGYSSRPSVFYNVTMMDSWMDELFALYNAE